MRIKLPSLKFRKVSIAYTLELFSLGPNVASIRYRRYEEYTKSIGRLYYNPKQYFYHRDNYNYLIGEYYALGIL